MLIISHPVYTGFGATSPATAPKTKLSGLRELMAAGDWRAALKMAAAFPNLGEHKKQIGRGWEACTRPQVYREMGKDPQVLIDAEIEALRARYGAGVAAGK